MSASAATGLTAQDLARIQEISDSFAEKFMARDFAGIAGLYTEDGVLMPPNHPISQGRTEIAAFMNTFPKLRNFKLSIDQVEGREDLACVRGSYEMTLELDGGETVEDRGKYLEVRRRQPDGRWLLSQDMFSSDLPA